MGANAQAGVAGVLAGLVLGIGIGYACFGGDPTGSGVEAFRQARTRTPKQPDTSPTKKPAAAPRRPPPETTAAGYRTLAEALADIPAPAIRIDAGDGVIRGRVATSFGEPLAGVSVVGMLVDAKQPARPLPLPEEQLERLVRRTVRGWHVAKRTQRATRTRTDGRYELTGLARARWRMMVRAPGYEITPSDRRAFEGVKPDATIDFTADRVVEVLIEVRMPDGARAERAELTIERSLGESAAVVTRRRWHPGQPTALRSGVHVITAIVSGGGSGPALESDPQRVTVRPGGSTPTIILRVADKIGVGGAVTFPADELEPTATVYLLQLAPGTAPDPVRLREEGEQEYVYGTDGRYEFAGLTPGTYALGVQRSTLGRMVAVGTVQVTAGLATHDITVPTPDPAQHWIVQVLDPDGAPCTDCSGFRIRARVQGAPQLAFVAEIRKAKGVYWLWTGRAANRPDGPGDAAANPLTLLVTSKSLGDTEAPLDAAQGNRLQVRYVRPATLTVRLHGYDVGTMRKRLDVQLVARGGNVDATAGDAAPEIAANGTATLAPVAPGDYDAVIRVRAGSRGTRRWWETSRTTVTLVAGANRIQLLAPKLHTLTLQVADHLSVLGVQVSPAGTAREDAQPMPIPLDDTGEGVTDAIPAGPYRIVLFREDRSVEYMRVEVPSARVVVFKSSPINALLVIIRDATLRLARAGLRHGDVLTGVDGNAFTDLAQIQQAIADAAKDGKLVFSVQRGSGRLAITVPARALMDRTKMGGELAPEMR